MIGKGWTFSYICIGRTQEVMLLRESQKIAKDSQNIAKEVKGYTWFAFLLAFVDTERSGLIFSLNALTDAPIV